MADYNYSQEFYPTNYSLDADSLQSARQYQQQQNPLPSTSTTGWNQQQAAYGTQEHHHQQQLYLGGQTTVPAPHSTLYSQQSHSYSESERMEVDPVPGSMGQMSSQDTYGTTAHAGFEDERPLLEELGIDFGLIKENTLSVLNPLQQADANALRNTDLAGPLLFCLLFGATLLLVSLLFPLAPSGKVHFGYIYGVGLLGCISMYLLLNLMSVEGVPAGIIVSVLGYCLLPMVLLSAVSIAISLQGIIGTILTAGVIMWCSYSSSKLFVSVLAMHSQQLLVAYPCALLYGVFALLTVF